MLGAIFVLGAELNAMLAEKLEEIKRETVDE
jgi:hypothetical protein